MANIYDKEFEASKRLDRTIFRGSPNLFTTADLNFQLENIRRDIKRSDWIHGAGGGMEISTSYNTGTGKLTVYLAAHGSFTVGGIHTPASTAQSLEITVGYNDPVYLFIDGTYAVKTYADDPTHSFVGAKFDDDTTMPAADQRVVENFAYHLARHDDEDPYWDELYEDIDTKFCFLIAKIVQIDATTAYIYKNFASDLDTPMMNPKPYINEITALDSEKELVAGDPFDVAISKLIKKDALRKSEIIDLSSRPYVNENSWHQESGMRWIIRNNNLLIRPDIAYDSVLLDVDIVSHSDKDYIVPLLNVDGGVTTQLCIFGSAFMAYVNAGYFKTILDEAYHYEANWESPSTFIEQWFIPLEFYMDDTEWMVLHNNSKLYGTLGLCIQKSANNLYMQNPTWSSFIGFQNVISLDSTHLSYGNPHIVLKPRVWSIPLPF